MAPGAITNFTRKNLPQEMWAYSISIFTVLFAISQTLGPYVAGLIGDYFDNIGMGLVTAFTILLLGALVSLSQKELNKN
jgi:MFS family permease